MVRKILLIVEGDDDEVKFLRGVFNKCSKKTEYKIYSYRTTIHALAQELYNNYNDFDNGDIDIKLVLASLEKDSQKKKLLLDDYSDVFLVFDFEPQHDHPHFDTVKRMIKYFNDSTNQGKLFINYPMMQSYKHFDKFPCHDFENLEVSMDEVKRYKELVGNISGFTDLNKYNYITFYSIAVHQLKKANKIANGVYELINEIEYFNFDLCEVFECEMNLLTSRQVVSVLNTCIFALIDFAPRRFFIFIEKHKDDLLM